MKNIKTILTGIVLIILSTACGKAQETISLKTEETITGLPKVAYDGEYEKLKQMLEKNFNPDERDSYGGTALHAAMFQDDIRIVKLLIEKGFDVNAIGPNNGYTPAHDAVWANNIEALKLLVENDADLSIKGKDGKTPLDKAIDSKKENIIDYLKQQ